MLGETTPLVKSTLAVAERLKADRSTTEATWQEIRDLIYPTAQGIATADTVGAKQGQNVLDNTGEQASELLAAALFAGVTPPHEPFVQVGVEGYERGGDRDADLWLDIASKIVQSKFKATASGFEPNQDEKLMDEIDFGTGCMFVGERPGENPLFQSRPIAECLLQEGDDGRVNANYRWYERTALQIVEAAQKRGVNPGEKVLAAAGDPKKQNDRFKLLHATYPRLERDAARADAANMAFASVWINIDEKHEIEVSGFPEFPYAVPRWRKRSGEVYGRGPGHKALADVKMLQRAMRAQIRGVEKTIDPSLIAADDGIMSPVRLGSGKITYVRADLLAQGRPPIVPLNTGGRPDLGEAFLDGVRERIQFSYFTHLIQFARDPKMTATQFLGITEQTQRVLAPIIARQQLEDVEPLVMRVLAIGFRSNWFPPLPERIAGREVKLSYSSPMVRMQNIGEVRAAAATLDMLVPLSTVKPEILDNFDTDQIARDTGAINGMRAKWLFDAKQVAATRQARREAAEAAAQAQQAETLSKAGANAAKAFDVIRGGAA